MANEPASVAERKGKASEEEREEEAKARKADAKPDTRSAAPPHKRAEKRPASAAEKRVEKAADSKKADIYPELKDAGWVRGNPAAAEKLQK